MGLRRTQDAYYEVGATGKLKARVAQHRLEAQQVAQRMPWAQRLMVPVI